MLLIGQSLECWRSPLADAVTRRDPAPLLARARRQLDAGAHALDVNFGATSRPGLSADLTWTGATLRAALPNVTLFLDTGDLEALAAAIKATPGPAVANSVPLEASLSPAAARLLEVIAAADAGVVWSPRAADAELEAAAILVAAEEAARLSERYRLAGPQYLDCLAYPPAYDATRARRSLVWLLALRDSQPEAHLAPLVAVGNVHHGADAALTSALEICYVAIGVASGAKALILRAEDRFPTRFSGVMTCTEDAATPFEVWARTLAAGRLEPGAMPPPPEELGPAYAEAWDLLTNEDR